MDFNSFQHLSRTRAWLQRRISEISTGALETLRDGLFSKLWKIGNRWKGVLLLGLSITLGIWANQLAQSRGALKWEQTHLPSHRVIELAMASRGLTALKDVSKLQKVLRTIPTQLDESGSIWLSTDARWFAYFSDPETIPQAQVFCRPSSSPPEKWHSLGLGWQGLERALEEMDKKLILMTPDKVKKRPYRDPREILY